MSELTIGEVARTRRTGLRTSALRYYEEIGILAPPRVRMATADTSRRQWPAVARSEVLRFAQQAGFTLEEIRTLFHGFGTDIPLGGWHALAQAQLRELDELVARTNGMREAIEAGLACGCVRVEDCIAASDRGSAPQTTENE